MKKLNKVFFSLIISLALLISIFPTNIYATSINKPTDAQGIVTLEKGTFTISQPKPLSLLPYGGQTSLNSVTIDWYISANNITRKIIHGARISNITGVAPVMLNIGQELLISDYANPNLFDLSNLYHGNSLEDLSKNPGASWVGTQIHVGAEIMEEVPAETKFWRIHGGATCCYPGSSTFTDSTMWDSNYIAINRTGNIFPDYRDPWSGKKASDELRTDWTKVSNPVNWNGDLKNIAIRQYIGLYGDPHYNWNGKTGGYQMHHIMPKAYGGTNDISNLMPLLPSDHTPISNWFNGYDMINSNVDPIDE